MQGNEYFQDNMHYYFHTEEQCYEQCDICQIGKNISTQEYFWFSQKMFCHDIDNDYHHSGLSSTDIAMICIFVPIGAILILALVLSICIQRKKKRSGEKSPLLNNQQDNEQQNEQIAQQQSNQTCKIQQIQTIQTKQIQYQNQTIQLNSRQNMQQNYQQMYYQQYNQQYQPYQQQQIPQQYNQQQYINNVPVL